MTAVVFGLTFGNAAFRLGEMVLPGKGDAAPPGFSVLKIGAPAASQTMRIGSPSSSQRILIKGA